MPETRERAALEVLRWLNRRGEEGRLTLMGEPDLIEQGWDRIEAALATPVSDGGEVRERDEDGYPVERGIPYPVDLAKLTEYNARQPARSGTPQVEWEVQAEAEWLVSNQHPTWSPLEVVLRNMVADRQDRTVSEARSLPEFYAFWMARIHALAALRSAPTGEGAGEDRSAQEIWLNARCNTCDRNFHGCSLDSRCGDRQDCAIRGLQRIRALHAAPVPAREGGGRGGRDHRLSLRVPGVRLQHQRGQSGTRAARREAPALLRHVRRRYRARCGRAVDSCPRRPPPRRWRWGVMDPMRLYSHEELRGAYMEGRQTGLAGRPVADCPSRLRRGQLGGHWRSGWTDGAIEHARRPATRPTPGGDS